jgi:hypothetical protein
MPVGDRDAGRCRIGEPANHFGRIGRVRHEEHEVVGEPVGDEVVHHAAGHIVAAHRVLRLTGHDAVQVVGQARVDELGRARSPYIGLAQMRHVEHPDRFPYRGVLLDHAAAGVLDRHVPTGESAKFCAKRDMTVVQRRLKSRRRRRMRRCIGHGWQPIASGYGR